MTDLHLRRKWTLRAHGQQIIVAKKPNESTKHVVMKALIWALYLPDYPGSTVEVGIGDRFKPDVVQTDPIDPLTDPNFWGEAGAVATKKYASLFKKYRRTHFAFGKWDTSLDQLINLLHRCRKDTTRHAPIDLIAFPDDSIERFIDDRGEIHISHDMLDWRRIDP